MLLNYYEEVAEWSRRPVGSTSESLPCLPKQLFPKFNGEVKASFFPLVFGAWFYKNEFLIKQVNYLFKAINFNAKKGIFHGGGECSSHHDRCLPQPRTSCCGVFYYFYLVIIYCWFLSLVLRERQLEGEIYR